MRTVDEKTAKLEFWELAKKSPLFLGLLQKQIPGCGINYGTQWAIDIAAESLDAEHFANVVDHFRRPGVLFPDRVEDLPQIIVSRVRVLMEADIKRREQHETHLEAFRREQVLKHNNQAARNWSLDELVSEWRLANGVEPPAPVDDNDDELGGVL